MIGFKALLGVLAEVGGVLYADHIRFNPCAIPTCTERLLML